MTSNISFPRNTATDNKYCTTVNSRLFHVKKNASMEWKKTTSYDGTLQFSVKYGGQ